MRLLAQRKIGLQAVSLFSPSARSAPSPQQRGFHLLHLNLLVCPTRKPAGVSAWRIDAACPVETLAKTEDCAIPMHQDWMETGSGVDFGSRLPNLGPRARLFARLQQTDKTARRPEGLQELQVKKRECKAAHKVLLECACIFFAGYLQPKRDLGFRGKK